MTLGSVESGDEVELYFKVNVNVTRIVENQLNIEVIIFTDVSRSRSDGEDGSGLVLGAIIF